MYKVLLFAGTTEGNLMARFLAQEGADVCACVATEYGREALKEEPNLVVQYGRLECAEMELKMREYDCVVDATHPYAEEVTANIRAACRESGKEYIRVIRKQLPADHCVFAGSAAEAAIYLKGTQGNVLLTTGSKDLDAYDGLQADRLYPRVLPTEESITHCRELGIPSKNIICMQGPFSAELNLAMLRQTDAEYIVTKDSGKEGGFAEKLQAARMAGVTAVVIARPSGEQGISLKAAKKLLGERISGPNALIPKLVGKKAQVVLIGCGMGGEDTLTGEANEAIRSCDCLIGAPRLLEDKGFSDLYPCSRNDDILQVIREHPEYHKIGVLVSGDPGFFSAARELEEKLLEYDVRVVSGLSSLSYFCAKLKISWDGTAVLSVHGRTADVAATVGVNQKTFILTGGMRDAGWVISQLCANGLGGAQVFIGENLGYPEENIVQGTAAELQERNFEPLCVMLVLNNACADAPAFGIPDSVFLRGDAPMTKFEVRCVSIAKLGICKKDTVYDIGAGTGSVSIEIARITTAGRVYAIEKKKDAISLLEKNKEKFRAFNLTVVEAEAPEGMEPLPAPDKVFIGGSSGNMGGIFELVLKKNPSASIVVNAITLETLAQAQDCFLKHGIEPEITQINASHVQKAGAYHMLSGANPVFILSGRRDANAE